MPAHTDQEVSDLKKKTNREIIDDYDYLANAVSSMDCTGLIPSLPKDEEEIRSYNEIYQFLPRAAAPKTEETHRADQT